MRILKNLVVFVMLFIAGCGRELIDDPIPLAAFTDYPVNLALPEYANLRLDGGYVEINTIGVRGVILHRVSATVYRAYERNCSFRPNEACATVDVHTSRLYLVDTCCNSTFDFDEGTPTSGPAWRPLRQYRTQLTGASLTISDEVINGL